MSVNLWLIIEFGDSLLYVYSVGICFFYDVLVFVKGCSELVIKLMEIYVLSVE